MSLHMRSMVAPVLKALVDSCFFCRFSAGVGPSAVLRPGFGQVLGRVGCLYALSWRDSLNVPTARIIRENRIASDMDSRGVACSTRWCIVRLNLVRQVYRMCYFGRQMGYFGRHMGCFGRQM